MTPFNPQQQPSAPPQMPTLPQTQKRKYVPTGNSAMDRLGTFSNGMSFFKKGIVSASPSKSRAIAGRVLPSFDFSLPIGSEAFMKSYIPYRVAPIQAGLPPEMMDENRNVPNVTGFFAGFCGYKMFGRGKDDILSPYTRTAYPITDPAKMTANDAADPLQDIRDHVWKLSKNDKSLEYWLKAPDSNSGAPIPNRRIFGMMNIFGTIGTQQQMMFYVGYLPNSGISEMLDRLAYSTPMGATQVADVNYKELLYGDITNPKTGLWAMSAMAQVGAITTWTFQFSVAHNSLQGAMPYEVPLELLPYRQVLDGDILNWQSYQDIVNIIVADNTIPHEWVQVCCSHMANIPPAGPQGRTFSFGSPATMQPNVPAMGVASFGSMAGSGFPANPAALQSGFAAPPAQPQMQQPVFNQPLSQPAIQPPAAPVVNSPQGQFPGWTTAGNTGADVVNSQPITGFVAPAAPSTLANSPAPTPPVFNKPQPPPPMQQLAAPVVEPEIQYWVCETNKNPEADTVPKSKAIELYAKAPDKYYFCQEGSQEWKKGKDLGFVLPYTSSTLAAPAQAAHGANVTMPPLPQPGSNSALPPLEPNEIEEAKQLRKYFMETDAPDMNKMGRMADLDKRARENGQAALVSVQ